MLSESREVESHKISGRLGHFVFIRDEELHLQCGCLSYSYDLINDVGRKLPRTSVQYSRAAQRPKSTVKQPATFDLGIYC